MHRAAPYLLRMAMLFALSDLSETIEPRHLEAALAWVRYWRESVKFIFNDAQEEAEQAKTCDKAERLYQWLKARSKPVTRTEITNDCFAKRGGSDVDKAIDTLLRDTPPRIEVIEGEKAANGKTPKLYRVCGLGGLGGVDCGALSPLQAVGIPDQVIYLVSHLDRDGNNQPDYRRTVKLAAETHRSVPR